MIAAEERISAVNDVLTVNPLIVGTSAVLIYQCIFKVYVATPVPKRVRWYSSIISKEVIAPLGTQSTSEAHERHLYWSSTRSEDFISGASGVAVQIDQNVDAVIHDLADESLRRPIAGIVEDRRFSFDLLTMDRLVTTRRGVAISLHAGRIMQAKHRLHQMRKRVIVEV